MLPIEQPTDEDLVRLSFQGSREAFGLLVTRHARTVRALLLARLGRHRDLDDMVQETFLRAYHGLRRLRSERCFPSYLRRIAHNLCIDRIRRRDRSLASLDEVDLEPAVAEADPRDESQDRLHRLREGVGRLPDALREAVLLFYFEEMSYARMAQVLGITEAAVNQRLSRARRKLRNSLGVDSRTTP